MNPVHRFQRSARWLVLLAVLVFTLLPTVSRALAAASGGWAEVCTPQGMKLVAVDDDGHQIATSLDACGHCTLSAHASPPPALPALALAPAGFAGRPPLWLQAPRLPFAWQPAQSRAPPSHA